MYNSNYKMVMYGKNIYKEFILNNYERETVKIGTSIECDVRFSRERFFEDFEYLITFLSGVWQISCSNNIYLAIDSIVKVSSKELIHRDVLSIKYQSDGGELMRLSFMMDFDSAERKYDRVIDISKKTQIQIGGSENSEIYISDDMLGADSIILTKNNNDLFVRDPGTKYGIYINGERVVGTKDVLVSNFDFLMLMGYSFYYKDGFLYTDSNNSVEVRNIDYCDTHDQKSVLTYPKFNRSTSEKYILPDKEIEILSPKAKPSRQKTNIFMLIVPPLAMLALTVVLRGFMGSGGTFVIYSVASMGLTLLASIAGQIFKYQDYKKEIKKRKKNYYEYISKKEIEISSTRNEELNVLQKKYRSIENNIETLMAFDNNMFDRSINDDDFLSVRIGKGAVSAQCKIKYKLLDFQDEEDDLATIPETLAIKYKYLVDAPIVSHFANANSIGVIGVKDSLYEMLKCMVVDIAVRHFYQDVKMIFIINECDTKKFSWIRWLRHIENNELNINNLICDEDSADIILDYIFSVLSKRESIIGNNKTQLFTPHFIVFVFDSEILKKHPITKYVESAGRYGFTFVFYETEIELLPKGCTEIIKLYENKNGGTISSSANSLIKTDFEYALLSDDIALKISLRIAPIYIDDVSLEHDLTKNISLFELLGIMSTDDINLNARWSNSRVDKSIAAPLGVKAKNEIVYLDLHEKHHGPHGLVAGTTGSGKSEILQSFILSAATLFHPYEVSFVIIDFKGGGMVNQFEKLPHLNGAITNIDGHEINRSLMSIKAELHKRQELFSANKVNHIDDYINLYKKDNSLTPLPHLIIIVDEFAELKTDQPEFMKELISAARIGRSLGVHLILATQKPSGVVDAQIWSNSKFKLCLKVQTKEDSLEVLKTPLAAEIVEPGRAYLQVGNNEIFDLFQSAYSGAKILDGNTTTQNAFEISELNLWRKRQTVFSNKKSNTSKSDKSQLQAIVEYVENYCIANNIKQLSGICLPPLKDIIYAEELKDTSKKVVDGIFITVGQYDDPELQMQSELILNLSESNTYIIGSSQTGKTAMLQTILKDLITVYTPQDVNAYVIDCGNKSLKVFEASKLIGGVVFPTEEERIKNLFKMLHNEITTRKNIFTQNMVSNYRAYIEAGFMDIAQIFLIIDNITAFREYYPECDTDILILSRDGQSVGINIIATATQTNAISYKIMSNYGTRIALNCNDKNEYSNLFARCRMEPKEVPGRALYCLNKRMVEFQTALCVKGQKEIERVKNLNKIVENMNMEYGNKKAKQIPQVPDIIHADELFNQERALYSMKYKIPIGISYDTVEYRMIDLLNTELFAVVGRDKSGKTNFVNYILSMINRTIFNNLTEAYILDGTNQSFEKAKEYGFVNKYSIDANDSEHFVDLILDKLEERQEYILDNRGVNTDDELLKKFPLQLFIIENNSFINEISKNKEIYAKFVKIIKQFKKLKVCIIFSNIENSTVPYGAPEVLKLIKEQKRAVIFDDVANIKFFEINAKYQKIFNKPITLGDGYLFTYGELEKIKTILNI